MGVMLIICRSTTVLIPIQPNKITMSLSVAKTFKNIFDAQVLRARLELEGIPCFGVRENGDMIPNFYGFFELKVSTRDIDRARIIVEAIDNSPILDDDG